MFLRLYHHIKWFFSGNKAFAHALYRRLGFYPQNIKLYEQAFIHRSSSIETEDGKRANNERLEFLGDAVLNAIVADIIYQKFPRRKEGFLTNTRSKIVQRESLNRLALEIGLNDLMVLSLKSHTHNNNIYGNAFEALIGAIYLDQGYLKCYEFIDKKIFNQYISLDKVAYKEVNFKSNLIEWSQKSKMEIAFELLETFKDEDMNPVFQSRVTLMGMTLGTGTGYTKKESQQLAAEMAIKRIRRDKDIQQAIKELKNLNVTILPDDTDESSSFSISEN